MSLRTALKAARDHCTLWQGEPDESSCSIHKAVIEQIDLALKEDDWQPIATAPRWKENSTWEDNEILCGFRGQFGWVSFVAYANGPETVVPGYANPTHWKPISPPKASQC